MNGSRGEERTSVACRRCTTRASGHRAGRLVVGSHTTRFVRLMRLCQVGHQGRIALASASQCSGVSKVASATSSDVP
jgi:hypothetical protein